MRALLIRSVVIAAIIAALRMVGVLAQGSWTATYYHPSLSGGTMFCGGRYDPSDTTVAALAEPACGQPLTVTGPAGTVNVVVRDKCGGCSGSMIDLSSAGSALVCGRPSSCSVDVEP